MSFSLSTPGSEACRASEYAPLQRARRLDRPLTIFFTYHAVPLPNSFLFIIGREGEVSYKQISEAYESGQLALAVPCAEFLLWKCRGGDTTSPFYVRSPSPYIRLC